MKLSYGNTLLCKLLAFQMNKLQMAGFVLANICGLFICFMAIQFYVDVRPLYTGNESIIRQGQIVLNKHVSMTSAMSGAPSFSDEEIRELSSQPFVDSVAVFESANFPVIATIGSDALGVRYSTEMFFESIPDGFLDINPQDWGFAEGDTEVPIIIPKNYLNLYNFGFAKTKGLPNISEGMIRQVPILLRIGDGMMPMQINARVVDFSRNINTVLVPASFLRYANRQFASSSPSTPSRVIVRVNNPADERIDQYLSNHNLETEGDSADSARTMRLLTLVMIAVLLVGAIICTLSFYLLLTSIYLLLQKNKHKLETLFYIGFSQSTLARPFVSFALMVNLVSGVIAVMAVLMSRRLYIDDFRELSDSYALPGVYPVLIAFVVIFIVMSILNTIAISRYIVRNN